MSGGASETLWLNTLQRICDLAAHEVKGALNGVAVNLEVVRSRSEKPDTPAANVSKFALSAAQQLDSVITLTEALLALARPAREPVDPGRVLRQVGDLLVPAAKADGRTLSIAASAGDSTMTSAAGNIVRGIIGQCLLAAVTLSRNASCHLEMVGATPTIRLDSCDGSTIHVGPEIIALAMDAGIHIVAERSTIIIRFPGHAAGTVEIA
jgi:signal transduction histidine kinase